MAQGIDSKGKTVPALGQGGTFEDITTSGTSQQSAALNGKFVRLVCTEDCYYLLGANPTAAAGSASFLPANMVETRKISVPSHKVAVIQSTISGTFNIEVSED